MKQVTIYTDGACRGNPGPGGYGAILIYGKQRKILKGGYRYTTNNRMELLATIEALKALKFPCKVKLYTDSRYIADAYNSDWITKWKNNNWLNASKQAVKNTDLWKDLDHQQAKHKVEFLWVKGHSDNDLNNEVDEIAVKASKDTANLKIDQIFEAENGPGLG